MPTCRSKRNTWEFLMGIFAHIKKQYLDAENNLMEIFIISSL
jgi:hypothetical protein